MEKPLHVRVAEALSWTDLQERIYYSTVGRPSEDGAFPSTRPPSDWIGTPPGEHSCPYAWDNEPCQCGDGLIRPVPRYDTDWSAGGPLIERYLPELIIYDHRRTVGAPGRKQAFVPGDPIEGWGETVLVAICNLILALKEAGKL